MAFVNNAGLALDGHDARTELNDKQEEIVLSSEIPRFGDGKNPPFEEYLYYAKIQREAERLDTRSSAEAEEQHFGGLFRRVVGGHKIATTPDNHSEKGSESEKNGGQMAVQPATHSSRLGDQQTVAYHALRVASWQSVFYLITTDILGPYSAPFAFAQVGYWPGVLVFFFFGLFAFQSGILLWYMYLKLDSPQYPVRHFGDLGEKIYGKWARHMCNILQSIQLIFNVGIIILGNGQGLSQIAKFRLCFSVCMVVWTLAGMIIGQIRTLQKFGWLANLSVWMNVFVMIATMAIVGHSLPNYSAVQMDPAPVQTLARVIQPFGPQVTGVMQIVFSYGGAMIFLEFMAEMRRPRDFWKGMALAQFFIFAVYMLFGVVVYHYQGQFSVNPANQGISNYAWQTTTNVISLTAGLIAAGLYGNIGVKVIYDHILREFFNFPSLTTKAGKITWVPVMLIYWALAFTIGAAIPQFSNISSLVAAVCIFQFTYTLPALFALGYQIKADAALGDGEYNSNSPWAHRVDTWRDWSRWKRGLFPRFWLKIWYLLFGLASLATAGLGAYSSIEGIIAGFAKSGAATSFGCHSPVQG